MLMKLFFIIINLDIYQKNIIHIVRILNINKKLKYNFLYI